MEQIYLEGDQMITKDKKALWLRSVTGLCLVVSLFVSSSMIVFAAPGKSLTGEIIVSGHNVNGVEPSVTINGERALNGRTFFNSGVISTPATNSAIVNLGKLGRLSLSSNTTLSLTLSENGISGELSAGQIHVYNSEGVSVSIRTPDNGVTNDATQAGDFTVDLTSGSTVATAENGEVFLEKGEAASAAKMSKRRKAVWIVLGAVAAIVIIAIIVSDDDDVTSPTR